MQRLHYAILFLCFLASGIALRLWSFHENSRLYGDVNLFALTARQLASSGKLEYPFKYDYSPETAYLSLQSPASQHPPLWPLLGAILARLWASEDTFLMLKVLSLIAGLCLWITFLPSPKEVSFLCKVLPFGLVALSPWLVDFSTNGSPYILIAFILILAERFWRTNFPSRLSSLVGAGALSAFAILTHNNLILIPLSLAIRIFTWQELPNQQRWMKLGAFTISLSIFLSPWLLWNWQTFGQLFHSLSSYYLLEQLGLATIALDEGRVVWTVKAIPFAEIAQRYSLLFTKSAWAGLRQYVEMITPLGFFAVLVSVVLRWQPVKSAFSKEFPRSVWSILPSPTILYLLTILLWATYKTRFLIPLLPSTYLLIGDAFGYALGKIKRGHSILWLGVVTLFIWMMLPYRQQPLNLYYGEETPAIARQYDHMRSVAAQLRQQSLGTVLGVSNSLDGGIETIYWTKLPFVMGRGLDSFIWRKLATDFHVRYLWADCLQQETLQQIFPVSQRILSNGVYCVLKLP